MRSNGISVISNRRHISLPVEDILYIQLAGRRAVIHASGGRTYETYTTIEELEQMLGSGFIRTDRATLVAAKGIHAIRAEPVQQRRACHAGRLSAALCQL